MKGKELEAWNKAADEGLDSAVAFFKTEESKTFVEFVVDEIEIEKEWLRHFEKQIKNEKSPPTLVEIVVNKINKEVNNE